MIEKKVFIRMNQDSSPKDLQNGEYRSATNLIPVSDGLGESVRLENLLDTEQIALYISESGFCVGMYNYKEEGKVYLFYSDTIDTIWEYDGITGSTTLLMKNNVLDFSPYNFVYDVFRVEDLLYFNDGVHGMRKINLEYAKTGALNDPIVVDERALSLIKSPPQLEPTLNRVTDNTITIERPRIRNLGIQFATRYVYLDDEVSVLSPISRVAPPLDWDFDDNLYNRIDVQLKMEADVQNFVKRVELLVRESNDSQFYIYDEFDPSEFILSLGSNVKGLDYAVFLDRSGAYLSETESGSPFESVPRISSAMEFMENRVFAVSTLEEYDVELNNWDCIVNIGVDPLAPEKLNDKVYTPKYYKENSEYIIGIVFEDGSGRSSAPTVRKNMAKQTPDNLQPYTLKGQLVGVSTPIIYNHPDAYTMTPAPSGKPPTWAKKYRFVRSANLSYIDWFQCRFLVKPLASTTPQTEEPPAARTNWYLENGFWYIDVNLTLQTVEDNNNPNYFAWSAQYFHLVIPEGFPIPIDENSLIRMPMDYDTAPNKELKKIMSVIRIDGGRILVRGIETTNARTLLYDEGKQQTAVNLGGGEVLYNSEIYLNLEVLNPLQKTGTPILYSVGKTYDVVNPGLDGRAFQPFHEEIPGDCYYTAYEEYTKVTTFKEDGVTSHSFPISASELQLRENRYQNSISYLSLSPVVDRGRAGTPTEGLAVSTETVLLGNDGFANFTFTSTDVVTGQYYAKKQNSRGRPTIEIKDQKELRRGSQVRFSNTYVQDSLINGLSNFPEENKYAISYDRGDIVKLVAINENVLVAVHTRAVTSLYINRNFINTGQGEFLAQSTQTVGDDRKMLLDYGTTHPESIVEHDGRVYGFDSIMGEPWRRSQDGITPIGKTFGMKTYFTKKGEQIQTALRRDPTTKLSVVGGYDPWLDMYILTFSRINYSWAEGEVDIPAETVGFADKVKLKGWVSFFTMYPQYYSSSRGTLLSANGQYVWRHNRSTGNRNRIYDQQVESQITIVSSDTNDAVKIYQNIGLSSTDTWSIECITQDGKESILEPNNFTKRNTKFYADFLRDINTDTATLRAGQVPLFHGEKMIGETMEITLTNGSSEKVVIDAVYIGYSPIVGHLLSQ